MEKSFAFIANLSNMQLHKIEAQKCDEEELKSFIHQLLADFKTFISKTDGYDILKRADNHIGQVAQLKANNPYLKPTTLKKLDILFDSLQRYFNPENDKLEQQAHEAAAIILDMYQALDTFLITLKLKNIIHNYKNHLENELRSAGITIKDNGVFVSEKKQKPSSKTDGLVTRYTDVSKLHEAIKNKHSLSQNDMEGAKNTFLNCLKHRPTWSEEPFLKKLALVLSTIFTGGLMLFYLHKTYNSIDRRNAQAIERDDHKHSP